MFALGRLPGWIAEWRELHNESSKRICRPRRVSNTGEPKVVRATGQALDSDEVKDRLARIRAGRFLFVLGLNSGQIVPFATAGGGLLAAAAGQSDHVAVAGRPPFLCLARPRDCGRRPAAGLCTSAPGSLP